MNNEHIVIRQVIAKGKRSEPDPDAYYKEKTVEDD